MRRNIRVSCMLRLGLRRVSALRQSSARLRVLSSFALCLCHTENVPGCHAGEKAGIVQLRLLTICMLLLGVVPSAAVFQAEGSGVSRRSDDKQIASLTRILGRLAQAMREGQSVCERPQLKRIEHRIF